MSAIARLGLAFAALVLQTVFLSAALPSGPDKTPARGPLTGQILVAAPEMGDPHFERTVILIAQHNESGALGIILNRPIGEEKLASVLEAVGEKSAGVTGSLRIFAGGPVQAEVGFVVHSAEYRLPETLAIDDRLSLTSNVKILRDIADRRGPAKTLVAFGYAGWGPQQLEREIEAGGWATAEADPALVFDADRDKLWDDAWKRRTQHL